MRAKTKKATHTITKIDREAKTVTFERKPVWPARVRVEVTAADIAAGCQGDHTGCPVALAVKRAITAKGLPEIKGPYVEVEGGRVAVIAPTYDGDDIVDGPWTRAITKFIAAFDERGATAVRPFSFWLPILKAARQ